MREVLARMRFERKHRRHETAILGGIDHAVKKRLVARVHAVEIADGDRARNAQAGIRETAENVHVNDGIKRNFWSEKLYC